MNLNAINTKIKLVKTTYKVSIQTSNSESSQRWLLFTHSLKYFANPPHSLKYSSATPFPPYIHSCNFMLGSVWTSSGTYLSGHECKLYFFFDVMHDNTMYISMHNIILGMTKLCAHRCFIFKLYIYILFFCYIYFIY